MKVKIEQINKYKVTIGDKTYDTFEKAEEWEGMIKFTSPDGIIIVHQRDVMADLFGGIFGGPKDNPKVAEFDVAKLSPQLIPKEDES